MIWKRYQMNQYNFFYVGGLFTESYKINRLYLRGRTFKWAHLSPNSKTARPLGELYYKDKLEDHFRCLVKIQIKVAM